MDQLIQALPAGWRLSRASGSSFNDHKMALEHADVLFVMAMPVTSELVLSAKALRFVQKMGAGSDRIDLDACRSRNVGVARLYAGNAIPVAEHALMLMLAACRRLPLLDQRTRAGHWDKEAARSVNRTLSGMTVGLVGFGAIGRRLAKLLSSFDVRLVYFDPTRAPSTVEAELRARYLDLDEILACADITSLHLPFNKETANLVDRKRIATMKRGAILVNCARGGLVDEGALASALREGRIFAAAIDAFASEPPTGNPLLDLPQTVVTPHCAGATLDNFANVAGSSVRNAQLYLAGQPLPPEDLILGPAHALPGCDLTRNP